MLVDMATIRTETLWLAELHVESGVTIEVLCCWLAVPIL